MSHARLSAVALGATVALASTQARAQHIERLRVAARPATLVASVDSTPRRRPPAGAPLVRTLTAVAGYAAGFYVGAYTGVQFNHRDTGDDFDGLAEAVLGGVVGGIAGSAVGAGAPELGSSCPSGRRVARALGGAAAGAAIGLVGVAGAWLVVATVPLGTVVGATIGAHGCHASST